MYVPTAIFEALWGTQKDSVGCSKLLPVSVEASDPHLGLQGPSVPMENATVKASRQKLNPDKLK